MTTKPQNPTTPSGLQPFRTFDEMHADCNRRGFPCSYFGDRGAWIVACGQHRDSDVLDRSNFRSIVKALKAIDSDAVAIESENHWAVGWVEHALVNPESPRAAELLQCLLDIRDGLEQYPVVDESDYSELETEECESTWRNCFEPRERLDYLRRHLERQRGKSYSASFRDIRAAINGDWHAAAQILPCPSDLIH